MKTRRKLMAGAPGTKKLLDKYVDRLLCVRYRYDGAKGRKMKTVELIEEEHEWHPSKQRIPANKIVKVKIAYGEIELGRAVKRIGGKWNRKQKVWEITYLHAINLGLQDRIVEEKEPTSRLDVIKKPP